MGTLKNAERAEGGLSMKRFLRVDVSQRQCLVSDVPPEYQKLGGRGLTSVLISREVSPLSHPWGPHNKLVIAPGILAGTSAPCCQRLSVGGKSPLTSGVKEANSGGTAALKMARLGFAAIILEGIPQSKGLSLLYIDKKGPRLEDAEYLKGAGNYEVSAKLREKYGSHIGIISIGPAGEFLMCAASVAINDKDGVPCRHAARGGLGAVMGSKGIKAIVLNDEGVPKIVSAADPERFRQTVQEFVKVIRERPRVKEALPKYGTSAVIALANQVNSLPTLNFRSGQFAGYTKIGADALVEVIDSRGGKRGHSCYDGCIVRCSNVVPGNDGKHLTSSLEYETLAMLGANCGLDDLETIATLDRLCDDYGLDTIEVGNAMGVAMEGGLLAFGDGRRMIELLQEIGRGTPTGRILGAGAVVTGKVFGVWRVAAVKGQGFPAWDPRTALATGVTFLTSPQGADHTAGRLQGVLEFGELDPGKIVAMSRDLQIRVCSQDTAGLCQFADGSSDSAEFLAKLVSAFYGQETTVEEWLSLGKKILKTERDYNQAAGISVAEDRLPEFMREEPLLPTQSTFTVTDKEVDELFNF